MVSVHHPTCPCPATPRLGSLSLQRIPWQHPALLDHHVEQLASPALACRDQLPTKGPSWLHPLGATRGLLSTVPMLLSWSLQSLVSGWTVHPWPVAPTQVSISSSITMDCVLLGRVLGSPQSLLPGSLLYITGNNGLKRSSHPRSHSQKGTELSCQSPAGAKVLECREFRVNVE